VVTGPLSEIAERGAEEAIQPPALTVVGPVAARRERLAWLERAPLHGRKVVITRARAQASGLAARLSDLGAEVVEAPAIKIIPTLDRADLTRAIDRIADFDVICLTSPNGAGLLLDALDAQGLDARA